MGCNGLLSKIFKSGQCFVDIVEPLDDDCLRCRTCNVLLTPDDIATASQSAVASTNTGLSTVVEETESKNQSKVESEHSTTSSRTSTPDSAPKPSSTSDKELPQTTESDATPSSETSSEVVEESPPSAATSESTSESMKSATSNPMDETDLVEAYLNMISDSLDGDSALSDTMKSQLLPSLKKLRSTLIKAKSSSDANIYYKNFKNLVDTFTAGAEKLDLASNEAQSENGAQAKRSETEAGLTVDNEAKRSRVQMDEEVCEQLLTAMLTDQPSQNQSSEERMDTSEQAKSTAMDSQPSDEAEKMSVDRMPEGATAQDLARPLDAGVDELTFFDPIPEDSESDEHSHKPRLPAEVNPASTRSPFKKFFESRKKSQTSVSQSSTQSDPERDGCNVA